MLVYSKISSNKTKTAALITFFLVLIIALGYVFSLAYQNPQILYFFAGFSILSSLISYFYSDKIALSISKAQEVDRNTNPDIYRLVENLCIAAGLPTPKIYIIDDKALNAFATGRDPKHSSICFTTGLLQSLDKTELEGVIAHELSHVGNYDIRLSTIIVVLAGLLTLLADFFLRFSFMGGRKRSSEGGGILIIIGIVLALISPIVATIIQLAISRKREYLADASGALLTRFPEGLANALEKIKNNQMPLEEASKATAHLYIANPLRDKDGHSTGFFAGLFNTHPPIEDRIRKLRDMNIA